MFNNVKSFFKNVKEKLNKKGSEIVAVALVLLFIILVAAPKIKTLGFTTSTGVDKLNTQLESTLNE